MSVVQNNTISTNSITEATSANGVSIDGLKVKDYSLMYGSNTGLSVDSSGRVLIPNVPAFFVYKTAQQTASGSYERVTWEGELYDQGSNFSSNAFTAPVAGIYQFNAVLLSDGTTGSRDYTLRVNSTARVRMRTVQTNVVTPNKTTTLACTLDIAKDDVIEIVIDTTGHKMYGDTSNVWTTFSGHLVG